MAVPDEVDFATEAALAKAKLGRALDAGVPAAFIAADEAYRQNYEFCSWCERRRIGHVVAAPRNQSIALSLDADISRIGGSRQADDLVARAPERAWKLRSAGAGVKGEGFYDWAVASPYPPENAPPGGADGCWCAPPDPHR